MWTCLPFFLLLLIEMLFFPVEILDRMFFVSQHSFPPFVIGMPALVHQLVYLAKLLGLNARLLH